MNQSDIGVLERAPSTSTSMVPAPARLTRAQLIENVATALDKIQSVSFNGLYAIEIKTEAEVREMVTRNTAFEPVAATLNEAGIPTNDKVGDIMDNLELSKEEVHSLVCNCHGDIITGSALATRFRALNAA